MKLISLILALLPLLAAVTACSSTKAPDAIDQVKAYEAAHNAYDVEATMALFAKDAVFELVGQATLPNLEAIRAIHGYDRGIQAQVTFQNCVADGLTVTCEAVEQNDWLSTAGLGGIFYPSSVFTFTETGQIQKIAATLSPEDGAAMGGVLAEFIPWLMTERPEEAKSLFTPEGVFIYSEVNGVLVIDLLAQWRAENS